ncbi:MAG TPA: tyrosine-protein phosphatase [Anaerolineae bacterium]|nr:tyrosine-protein phosphatase [Anaerolineae bacterium]HQI86386.1 tyrosine-protein phosphatase [Anaerolineae bacterium]
MERLINFRDFGGCLTADGRRVKTGYLYRSGHVDQASRRDRETLRALGIKTLVDLRSARERKQAAHLWPGARVVWLPMPFDEITRARLKPYLFRRDVRAAVFDMVESVYADTVEHSCAQLAALFTLLQQPEVYPVLIHCRAGRDRTGFVSAVIQLALGVPVEDVVTEYLRSNASLLPRARRAPKVLQILTLGLFSPDNLRAVFTSQERYMRTVIGKIEGECGGIVRYLTQCGVAEWQLAALKDLLLERSDDFSRVRGSD